MRTRLSRVIRIASIASIVAAIAPLAKADEPEILLQGKAGSKRYHAGDFVVAVRRASS